MNTIRVLVVADAAQLRRVLTEVLGETAGIEIAGVAANGRIALQQIPEVAPDLITLDVEMPEMDGVATLEAIRAEYPALPVIMYGDVTERAARAALDPRGITDWVAKPSGDFAEARRQLVEGLIPRIRALGRLRRPSPKAPALFRPPGGRARPPGRIELVAIGCSTGGPDALTALFRKLPASLPVPIVVTQHLPPLSTRHLAGRLDAVSEIAVAEAPPGAALRPGFAWIAPGDHHLVVDLEDGRMVTGLNQDPPENGCRPAVDPLFRSAAQAARGRVLAVVLTGIGSDATLGARAVREAGGQVIVQDEPSSVVWGMPGAVVEADLADAVLPLGEIAVEIIRRASAGRSWSPPPLAAIRG
jgi:two-component system chemotaxis response regulator CheB